MELGTHDVRPLPFYRDWEIGVPSCLMMTFQRGSSQVKTFPLGSVKLERDFKGDLYTFQRGRDFAIRSFLKQIL